MRVGVPDKSNPTICACTYLELLPRHPWGSHWQLILPLSLQLRRPCRKRVNMQVKKQKPQKVNNINISVCERHNCSAGNIWHCGANLSESHAWDVTGQRACQSCLPAWLTCTACEALHSQCRAQADYRTLRQIKNWTYDDDGWTWRQWALHDDHLMGLAPISNTHTRI